MGEHDARPLQNVFRPPLLDGRPATLGSHFLGDAYCHTNPLFAWGVCLGVDHGFALGRIIDDHALAELQPALPAPLPTRSRLGLNCRSW